jgi:uncharacterized protein (TIGR00369 family)
MSLAATEGELRRVLRAATFTRHYRFRLEAIGEGRCVIRAPFARALERPGGIVSGPVFMAAADAAMWLAVMTRLGPRDRSVTSTLTTTFLRAAREEDVVCEARVLKLGRRLIYGVAECAGATGQLLSHHVITYARAEAQPQSRIQDSARGMSGTTRPPSSSAAAGARRSSPSTSARR